MNEEIFKQVSEELGISYDIVEKVMKTFFNFVRFRISKVKYKNLTTFIGVKTNFVLPGFGKLVVKNKTDRRLHNARNKTIED
jgi:nucleoid DNA-binding protein